MEKIRISFLGTLLSLVMIFSVSAGITTGVKDPVTNTGTVVDGDGNPVKSAYVTYTSFDKRFTWSYTDGSGNFGDETGIKNNPSLSYGKDVFPLVKNSSVTLPVKHGKKITVDIFDLCGKKIARTIDKNIEKTGYLTFSPFDGISAKAGSKLYLVKINTGCSVSCVKMFNLENSEFSYQINDKINISAGQSSGLEKGAAVDTIRVGKNGYLPAKVAVEDYTSEITDNIVITKFNMDEKIDSILSTMDYNTKAGQLTQCNLGNQGASWIGTNKIGFAMCGGSDSPGGSGDLSITSWADYDDDILQAGNNNGLPVYIGIDNVHGLDKTIGGTILPHNCGLGSTWNPQLVELAWRMAAIEMRGIGHNWVLAPCAAVPRDDRWGRLYEGFGEEPNNTAALVKAATLGTQGSDLSHPMTAAVCLKHFIDGCAKDGLNAAHEANTTGIDGDASNEGLTKEEIFHIHTMPYSESFKVGAASVMISYHQWYGISMHQRSEIMTDLLKNDLQFEGWANGDWQAHINDGGTLASSVDAGLDVAMPGHTVYATAILNDYKNIAESKLDASLRRVLRQKITQFYSNGYRARLSDSEAKTSIGCADHHTIARVAARQSMVLLKNNNSALPVSSSDNIAMAGKHLRHEGLMCGGWTYAWQGNPNQDVTGVVSFVEGLENAGVNVTYTEDGSNLGGADIAVVSYGEEYYSEAAFPDLHPSNVVPFDGQDIAPSRTEQANVINSVASQVETTILVVFCGRPINITQFANNSDIDAIIIAWWPGSQGGNAFADLVIDNEHDFTGKLAYTWPTDVSQEPINWGYPGTGADNYGSATPLYNYGHGMDMQGNVFTAADGLITSNSIESLE